MNEEPTEKDDEAWCLAQRENLLSYLSNEGFREPTVGDWPAWHVAPIVSIWAIESVDRPGRVGWWAVSGDFPTDYTPCREEAHPRHALRDIGLRWREAAAKWAEGQPAKGWHLGDPSQEKELGPLLAARAELFLKIAADDVHWEE